MKPLTPYGCRNSKPISLTSSTSPGAAPSTKIGPVIGCAPGPRSVTPSLDGLQRVRNLGLGCPRQPDPLQSARDHRLNAHAIAGCNPQHRRNTGIVVTPMHVRRRQSEIVHAGLLCPRAL